MSKTLVKVIDPRRLPKTVQTLRKFGLYSSSQTLTPLTIAPCSSSKPSPISSKAKGSIPALLVPDSTTPAKTLALLRKLGTSSPGPFFAAGKAGQINAALFAAACLAPQNPKIRKALDSFRSRQTSSVPLCP